MEIILALALTLLLGNSSTQNQVKSENTSKKKEIYNPSVKRLSDIIHTDLTVSFHNLYQYNGVLWLQRRIQLAYRSARFLHYLRVL